MPNTSFSGTVAINYTAFNIDGDSYNGQIKITVNKSGSNYFSDVGEDYSWAERGDKLPVFKRNHKRVIGNGKFGCNSNISRGDLMLMIYRAFKLKGTVNGNFTDVPSGSYYYTAIGHSQNLWGSERATDCTSSLPLFVTREDAMVMIVRALQVSSITIKSGSESDLSAFTDKKQRVELCGKRHSFPHQI